MTVQEMRYAGTIIGQLPKLVKALERIAEALENQSKKEEGREERRRRSQTMKCCICGKVISLKESHNPEPICSKVRDYAYDNLKKEGVEDHNSFM